MGAETIYCERCGYRAGLCQCAAKALVAHNNQQAAKSICRGDSMPIMGGKRRDDPPIHHVTKTATTNDNHHHKPKDNDNG